eukprot:2221091-Pyramimonas_sp.AAC.1
MAESTRSRAFIVRHEDLAKQPGAALEALSRAGLPLDDKTFEPIAKVRGAGCSGKTRSAREFVAGVERGGRGAGRCVEE